MTPPPPCTQTLLGIFDGSFGARSMSKAQKRQGHKGRLNVKGGAPRPVFRPSHDLLRRDYRRYSQETLEYEADNINSRHLSSFLCSFTSLLQCELTRERDSEKLLWLLPLQFSGFGVATLFSPMIFCKISARKKQKWIKKIAKNFRKSCTRNIGCAGWFFLSSLVTYFIQN